MGAHRKGPLSPRTESQRPPSGGGGKRPHCRRLEDCRRPKLVVRFRQTAKLRRERTGPTSTACHRAFGDGKAGHLVNGCLSTRFRPLVDEQALREFLRHECVCAGLLHPFKIRLLRIRLEFDGFPLTFGVRVRAAGELASSTASFIYRVCLLRRLQFHCGKPPNEVDEQLSGRERQ